MQYQSILSFPCSGLVEKWQAKSKFDLLHKIEYLIFLRCLRELANHFGGDFERALKNSRRSSNPAVGPRIQPAQTGDRVRRKAIFDFHFSVTVVKTSILKKSLKNLSVLICAGRGERSAELVSLLWISGTAGRIVSAVSYETWWLRVGSRGIKNKLQKGEAMCESSSLRSKQGGYETCHFDEGFVINRGCIPGETETSRVF